MSTGLQNRVYDAEITVTDGGSGAFTVAIQLNGVNDEDLTVVGAVPFYVSTQDDGSDIATNSTDLSALAIGTDGLCIEWGANVSGLLVSESDGDIDLAITVASTKTVYLVLVMPDGTLVISDAMSYT
jgi:hypothetical protein